MGHKPWDMPWRRAERRRGKQQWRSEILLTEDDLDGGWVAQRLDLPGCVSQGDTRVEALTNLDDAAEAWLAK